jgi:hypothetical protein
MSMRGWFALVEQREQRQERRHENALQRSQDEHGD